MSDNNGEAVLDELEGLFESEDAYDNDESESEPSEFWPGFPLPPIFGQGGGSRSRGGSSPAPYRSPGPMPFVTKSEFSTAMNRVRRDVRVSQTATKTVGRAVEKQAAVNAKQTQQIAHLRRDMKKSQDMSLIMLLINRPRESAALTQPHNFGSATLPAGAKLQYSQGGNSLLLPLLLMGGLGGGEGSGGMDPLIFLAMSGNLNL